jgi:2-keto-4-pentenoate hydratase/2-oxohepta-3-ene-1,7-dioic acid hydratase in catechol pathway
MLPKWITKFPKSRYFFSNRPLPCLTLAATFAAPPFPNASTMKVGVIIAKRCYRLPPGEDVHPYILGYTAVNDVSARDLQKKDNQWARAKGFDTSCPAGPLVSDEIDPWSGVAIETRVNGQVRQHGNTRDFVFPIDVLIRYISDIMTLMPGDLLCTGTPGGVGPVMAGDVVEVSVEGVGKLRNSIIAD